MQLVVMYRWLVQRDQRARQYLDQQKYRVPVQFKQETIPIPVTQGHGYDLEKMIQERRIRPEQIVWID